MTGLATTLGDICAAGGGAIQTGPFGSQLHASDYSLLGTPVVMPQDIGDNSISESAIARVAPEHVERLSRHQLAPGDIVYSRRGDVERRALVREPEAGWLCGTGCLRVTLGTRPVADPRFVSYYLGTEWAREWIVRHAVGATMLNLNTAILSRVPINLPAMEEQRAIAEVLEALDDKTAANAAKEATAAALVEALHRDVVRTEGTIAAPLMEVLSVDFGEAFKGVHFSEPGVGRPLIRIRDLKTFTSQVWTEERRPSEVLVLPGDVVVGMDAEFRPTWWLGDPGLLNQRVCRVHSEGAGAAFVREALRAPMARIEGHKTGTTVIHLNKADMQRESVLWPSSLVREQFDRRAEPVLAALVQSAIERRVLVDTRDSILPGLMSGTIKVKDAERVVEGMV